jgi:ABC-type transporter Mla MlaB component
VAAADANWREQHHDILVAGELHTECLATAANWREQHHDILVAGKLHTECLATVANWGEQHHDILVAGELHTECLATAASTLNCVLKEMTTRLRSVQDICVPVCSLNMLISRYTEL